MSRTILVTGGAGFIGSHVVRLLVTKYPECCVVNLDSLTYAGNLENLVDIQNLPNYHFEKADITDEFSVGKIFEKYQVDQVIHLAAESHVDRSILEPMVFVRTNVVGTTNLLNACCRYWKDDFEGKRFYQISTDEVYGSLGVEGLFSEDSKYDPRSPYSASKAGADHQVRAYYHTYGLPVVISNCSNNYGSHQFPEKLIPLVIRNIKSNEPIPVYGKGENIRDWLWVTDHAMAIDLVLHKGKIGETYNIGGFNEWKNIDLILLICSILDKKLLRPTGTSKKLISFIRDRPGHDHRYAIDASKITRELNWSPSLNFKDALERTIDWYLDNEAWLKDVTSGEYLNYYNLQYSGK
jgi:dTDP-glucose 4,6-dehydratase